MYRRLRFALSFVLLTAILVGCQPSDSAAPTAARTDIAAQAQMRDAVKAFNAEHGRPPSRSWPQQIVGGAIPASQPEERVESPSFDTGREGYSSEESAEACAEACAACGGCVALLPFLAVMWFVIGFVFLVWVARDAKARNIDSAALWMVFVLVTGVIGLVIYILARPEGKLVQCPHCHNKRLEVSATCPHCGNT